jgi:flagellar protein FliO/FliZ
MDPIDYLHFLAALAFVLGLIALAALAARRWRLGASPARAARRLAVVEVLPIDPRRKLVLVRCDRREHLLLLGQDGNRLIAGGPPPADQTPVQEARALETAALEALAKDAPATPPAAPA